MHTIDAKRVLFLLKKGFETRYVVPMGESGSISTVSLDDEGLVQFEVKPSDGRWRTYVGKIASVNHGKSVTTLRVSGWWWGHGGSEDKTTKMHRLRVPTLGWYREKLA